MTFLNLLNFVYAVLVLFISLYLGASLWLLLKRRWAKNVTYDKSYPQFTTPSEIAAYFELPLAEVQRRQSAGKLIITENFEHDRIHVLRDRAIQSGLQSDWIDD